jgi:hypothetical protein
VTGEPGIGKTRLAEAAADRSRAGPAGAFEVIWTWCPSAAGGAPLHPWSRVVRILANGHTAAARLVDGSPFLAAVAGRAGTPDPAPAGGPPDPEGARSQLDGGHGVIDGMTALHGWPGGKELRSVIPKQRSGVWRCRRAAQTPGESCASRQVSHLPPSGWQAFRARSADAIH